MSLRDQFGASSDRASIEVLLEAIAHQLDEVEAAMARPVEQHHAQMAKLLQKRDWRWQGGRGHLTRGTA